MNKTCSFQLLKKKLRDRLEVRQKAMEEQQRTELQEILVTCKNKTAMRIREALLLHKQMIAMEQFRSVHMVQGQIQPF